MTSIRPKSKKIGKTIEVIRSKKGKWEVFTYKSCKTTYYANRLVSPNGWIVCTNIGFKTKKNALSNIAAVRKLA